MKKNQYSYYISKYGKSQPPTPLSQLFFEILNHLDWSRVLAVFYR